MRASKTQEYLSEILIYIGAVIKKENTADFFNILKQESNSGENVMKSIIDAIRDEGRIKGIEEGKLEDKYEITQKMLSKGIDIKEIHELTDLPVEKILKIKNQKKK